MRLRTRWRYPELKCQQYLPDICDRGDNRHRWVIANSADSGCDATWGNPRKNHGQQEQVQRQRRGCKDEFFNGAVWPSILGLPEQSRPFRGALHDVWQQTLAIEQHAAAA